MTLTAPSARQRRLARRWATPQAAGTATSDHRRRWIPSWPAVLLAAIAYLPLLVTAPNRVGVDTKAYLYLHPTELMRRAGIMWDPGVGMGIVTHQNIGFLLPQGMFFWLLDVVGLPTWVAQRLWTGSVLFLAGAGVLFAIRSFHWPNRFAFVAAAGYMLTPYVLEYEARMTAILLPYTGLGWLLGITIRGLREARGGLAAWGPGGWRWPAAFGLTVALVGSSNASSLIFVLLGPILWLLFALVTREVRLGPALGMCVRAFVLVGLCSAWWIAGLITQAGYGVDILVYSETLKTVASASQASEVVRGLGNWYFYGGDALGAWIAPARDYTQTIWVIAVSFAVPLLGLAGAALCRWGYKAYFVTLVLVGTTVSVGVYPYDDPSPLGGAFRAFAETSTAGFALRSMPRAVPLVALGLSVLLAAGLAALSQRLGARRLEGRRRSDHVRDRFVRLIPGVAWTVALVLIVANLSPLWRGRFVEPGLDRPAELPAYETALAADLEAAGPATRVLELPGADFAHYRWGTTLDPVQPGLIDRPYLVRELIPVSSAASADLLRALDRRLQEGVFETAALADVARLMGVGDVVLRTNLQYERFRTPRPAQTWELFTKPVPAGLQAPRTYGPPVADTPQIPFNDEIALGRSADAADPPALAAFGVTAARPIVRTATTQAPLLVSGNGEGLVDAAAAGLLAGPVQADRAILYTASMATDPAAVAQALADGADLLLTDSNRRRAERWSGIRDGYGYVESPGLVPLADDPNDNRLPIFPDATATSQTVALLNPPGQPTEIASVNASEYGNAFSYSPAERPTSAVDGDLRTMWRVGAFTNPAGQRLRIDLARPVTTDRIRLVQPIEGNPNRWITGATLRFDGGAPVALDLTDASRAASGQLVRFPERTFTSLEIRIEATNIGTRSNYSGLSAVGFAEVDVIRPDGSSPHVQEILRMPTDLLGAAGRASLDHRLMVQFTRDRSNPAEPFKFDTEPTFARVFTLPTERSFALTGTARVSAYSNDVALGASAGRPSGGVITESSGRLPGLLAAGSASAFDGDLTTMWSPGFGMQKNLWIQANSPAPVSFSSVSLSIVADGRHSVPTAFGLVVDGKRVQTLTVPPLGETGKPGDVRTVKLSFPTVRGSHIRLTVDQIRPVVTRDPISATQISMPIGLAEVDIAGLRVSPPAASVPGNCRDDLLTVDGKPVRVRITGSSSDALTRSGLAVSLCGGPLVLGPGDHVLRTADGAVTGYDLDRLILASEPGGGPSPVASPGSAGTNGTPATSAAPPAAPSPSASASASVPGIRSGTAVPVRNSAAPAVAVTGSTETSVTLQVTGAEPGKPFWLVLGQSLSAGWKATSDGVDHGKPRLIDGYANGWRVTPTASSFTVDLTWTPQNLVRRAILLSGATLLASVALLVVTARRRRRRAGSADSPAADLPIFEPLVTRGAGVGPVHASLTAAALAGAGVLLVNPVAGAVTGICAFVALWWPRGRLLLRFGPVVALALSASYVIQVQARHRLPISGEWVQAFDKIATVSWIAVLLLTADVVVAAVHRRRNTPATPATRDV